MKLKQHMNIVIDSVRVNNRRFSPMVMVDTMSYRRARALEAANQFILDEGHANSGPNPLSKIWMALAKAKGASCDAEGETHA